ncbi:AsmA family protein [Duganella sp. FT80W]|uniref:AsmA family protein n=1 Tax=Duganella guangzhouensis TaxID=2666084 RepID=A0A6I2KSH0_9BURK|nr:AsmA family protein [Duganella guangzhouensis]MRW88638.1 AsmA family protein [Duganella guangzhouensis]
MKLSRPYKIIAGLLATLLVVLAAVVIFILTFDWNRARPWINHRVTDSIGREFAINGDLRVHWQQGDDSESGWRRYVPRPRISAADVSIANPTWTTTGPRLANVGSIVVEIHPLPLLHKEVVITDLEVDKVTVAAQRRADGSNTWTFKDNGPSEWEIDIQRLALGEGDLRYLDDGIKLDLRAKASGINEGADAQKYGLRFDLSGSYRNAPVTGGGKIGKVLSLREQHANFPVQAQASLGKNKIAVEGQVTDPRAPAGLDLKLSLAGASMADLYPLTGVLLPETPPYATTGRLIGKKSGANWNWTYKDFSGTVGGSDLEGTLAYSPRSPRPLLSGSVTSRQLRLEDLGPTIGAESNASKAKRDKPQNQPADKALPVEQFNTEKWGALDADVKFTGKKLVRTHDIPLQDIQTHIRMNDKVLTLTPLNFGMAGGDITSNIKLDGRQKQIDAQVRLAARHLKIRELFPKLESMQASVGEVSADAALAGKGNSVSAMLASSSGELGAAVSEGSVSKFILEAAGLNIANLVFVKLFGDKQIQLNCAAGDFVVEHGKAQTRRFVIDTQEAVININGYVDLASESLDLDVRPQTKGVRIVSLRTPLYARGTFTNPKVGPQAGPLALKAGAAVALATIVTPVAAIIPLVNPGKVDAVDCAAALAEANQTRTAARTQPVQKKR